MKVARNLLYIYCMKQISLQNSELFALVDDEDYEKIRAGRWNVNWAGYAVVNLIKAGQPTMMHRLILGATRGQIVDHKDGNKLNNQKSNLRICSHSENLHNTGLPNVNKSSRYKGVSYTRRDRSYACYFCFNNNSIRLLTSQVPEECAYAHDCAIDIFGLLAYKNNVDSCLSEERKQAIKARVIAKTKHLTQGAS